MIETREFFETQESPLDRSSINHLLIASQFNLTRFLFRCRPAFISHVDVII